MTMNNEIRKSIAEHQEVVSKILQDEQLQEKVNSIIHEIVLVFKNKGRLLLCGNGGSAADAQHLAAEFSGRFALDRKPLDAEALHVNSSYMTAVGNDYNFDTVYERALEAKGRSGDLLIAFSTSGASNNVLRACAKAKEMSIKSIGFTGDTPCPLDGQVDTVIKIPSSSTPRIQEAYMVLGHIICEQVESRLFG